jgi:hypothetical protein
MSSLSNVVNLGYFQLCSTLCDAHIQSLSLLEPVSFSMEHSFITTLVSVKRGTQCDAKGITLTYGNASTFYPVQGLDWTPIVYHVNNQGNISVDLY